ncbi:hypothetical protein [Nocardia brevicatena]|uniref:hypothetical protein n=1 Tax=Nocardia brevicatena TaxID=37327 RepID=UPI000316CAD8|nr:hypothetical protein [Nocardia brevicatena]
MEFGRFGRRDAALLVLTTAGLPFAHVDDRGVPIQGVWRRASVVIHSPLLDCRPT